MDTMIATRCTGGRYQLLYGDRDPDPFVEHLGLRSAQATVACRSWPSACSMARTDVIVRPGAVGMIGA